MKYHVNHKKIVIYKIQIIFKVKEYLKKIWIKLLLFQKYWILKKKNHLLKIKIIKKDKVKKFQKKNILKGYKIKILLIL